MTFHAAVWLDHEQAKVFHVTNENFDESIIHAPADFVKHHREGHGSHGPQVYFGAIAKALSDAHEILVVGPGSAKLEFIRYVHQHAKAIEPKIVGVETVDHPTDGQLVAYIRKYYRAKDRMLASSPKL
jgi:stalled ribosome rescue protein Dom34